MYVMVLKKNMKRITLNEKAYNQTGKFVTCMYIPRFARHICVCFHCMQLLTNIIGSFFALISPRW